MAEERSWVEVNAGVGKFLRVAQPTEIIAKEKPVHGGKLLSGLRKQRETNSAHANDRLSHLHQARDFTVFSRAQNGFKVGKNLVAIHCFKSP